MKSQSDSFAVTILWTTLGSTHHVQQIRTLKKFNTYDLYVGYYVSLHVAFLIHMIQATSSIGFKIEMPHYECSGKGVLLIHFAIVKHTNPKIETFYQRGKLVWTPPRKYQRFLENEKKKKHNQDLKNLKN